MCFLACAAASAAPEEKMFSVISGLYPDATVSFPRGKNAGVSEKDVLYVVRDGKLIAQIIASDVGEYVTRAKLVKSVDIIRIGDGVKREGAQKTKPRAEETREKESARASAPAVPVKAAAIEQAAPSMPAVAEVEAAVEAPVVAEVVLKAEAGVEFTAAKAEQEAAPEIIQEKKKENAVARKADAEAKPAKKKARDAAAGIEAVHIEAGELSAGDGKPARVESASSAEPVKTVSVSAVDLNAVTSEMKPVHVYPGKEQAAQPVGGALAGGSAAAGGKAEAAKASPPEPVHIRAGEIRRPPDQEDREPLPYEETIPGGGDVPAGGVNVDREALELVRSRKFKLELSGYRYFKYRAYSSSGNSGSFMSRNGLLTYGNKFEQGTMLTVVGKYGDNFEVTGELNEQYKQERTIDFSLKAGLFNARFGDFSSTFRSGSLVNLNKKITGVQVQYDSTKVKADYVVSNSKSNSKTITFFGDNTHGPYSLRAFQILDNSESVSINGIALKPEEYIMDYFSGQITFCPSGNGTDINCREVKTTDKVQVVFEEKLLFSDKGGTVNAMSVGYQLNDTTDIGFAHVSQESSRGTQRVRKATSYTITGADLSLQAGCPLFTICLPKTYKSQYVMMVKRFEKVTKNGQPLLDFLITDEGYAYGEVALTTPYFASDTFVVEYSYYSPEFVNEIVKESEDAILRSENGDTPVFYLNNGIYSGTEQAYYCELNENTIGDCDNEKQLIRGVDYRLNEDSAIIEILNPNYYPNDNLNRYLRVAYFYVPRTSDRDSLYDHTVSQVYGGATIGPVNLKYEYGWSEGDASKTPVQVLKFKVVTADKSYKCPNSSTAVPGCSFQFNHANLVELSESITVTDRERPLRAGIDYNIDYDAGVIKFTNNYAFSTGATIVANYQYLPDIRSGIASGNATIIDAGAKLWNFNVSAKMGAADTFFIPVEGNTALETSRNEYRVDGELVKGLKVNYGIVTFDRASDIAETSSVKTDQNTLGFEYMHKKGHSFKYEKTTETAQDNLRVRDVDSSRDGQEMTFGFKELFLKGLQLDFNIGSEDVVDKTGNLDNTESSVKGLTVAYSRERLLDLSLQLEKNELTNAGVSGKFTSENFSKNMILSYYPTDNIQVETDIKAQIVTDSRASGGSGKNESTISVTANSMGKVRNAVISHTNNSFPGYNSGSTNSSTSIMSLEYGMTKDLSLIPSLNLTSTDADQNTSSNTKKGIKFDYRPGHQKYAGSLTFEFSDLQTASPQTRSSGSQNRILGDMIYKFNEKTNLIYRLDKNDYAMNDSSSTTLQNSFSVNFKPSDTRKFMFQFNISNQSSVNQKTTDTSTILKSDMKLSRIFSWVTEIKRSKFEAAPGKASNYNGTLVESEIRAEF